MIVVRLIGGLGNQLFQYALGRSLAEANKDVLKLDISAFANYKLRTYCLNYFNIVEEIALSKDIKSIVKGNGIRFIFNQIFGRSNDRVIHEKYFHFDPEILTLKGNIYLDGYWQTAKYFADIEDIIRDEFSITIEPDLINKQVYQLITEKNAISVHIRRTDYVNNPTTHQFHGICSLEYYRTAIELMVKKVSSPHFFVFSDDIPWVKENLKIDYPVTFVAHNGPDKGYEDLRLMEHCKHHIIANSTFSWWGAWLSTNKEKLVIAPRKWFSNDTIDTQDLLPNSWIKL